MAPLPVNIVNSDHQDYYMFRIGDSNLNLYLPLLQGGGPYPTYKPRVMGPYLFLLDPEPVLCIPTMPTSASIDSPLTRYSLVWPYLGGLISWVALGGRLKWAPLDSLYFLIISTKWLFLSCYCSKKSASDREDSPC